MRFSKEANSIIWRVTGYPGGHMDKPYVQPTDMVLGY